MTVPPAIRSDTGEWFAVLGRDMQDPADPCQGGHDRCREADEAEGRFEPQEHAQPLPTTPPPLLTSDTLATPVRSRQDIAGYDSRRDESLREDEEEEEEGEEANEEKGNQGNSSSSSSVDGLAACPPVLGVCDPTAVKEFDDSPLPNRVTTDPHPAPVSPLSAPAAFVSAQSTPRPENLFADAIDRAHPCHGVDIVAADAVASSLPKVLTQQDRDHNNNSSSSLPPSSFLHGTERQRGKRPCRNHRRNLHLARIWRFSRIDYRRLSLLCRP